MKLTIRRITSEPETIMITEITSKIRPDVCVYNGRKYPGFMSVITVKRPSGSRETTHRDMRP